MNLALVIERFDLAGGGGGGAERSTAQIARELVGRGHRVTILTGYASREDSYEFAVEAFSKHRRLRTPRLLAFARWATDRVTRGGFDSSLSVTTAVPAAVLQPRSGTIRETLDRNIAMRPPGISRAMKRLSIVLSPKHRALLALERRTLASPVVKRIAAVSRYVEDQLVRHYAIDRSRIEIIPNAAAMPRATSAQRAEWRASIRNGFGISDETPTFFFAAHNPQLKGQSTLLRAIQLLEQRGLKVVVLIAGPTEYSQQRLIASMGVREHVRLVGPTSQMAALYCAADVTVLPTYYDPSSKVVIESLMMGTPAISTSFNGASDFLKTDDGRRRGRVIADPGDAEALASAMAELADPVERDRCRAASVGLEEPLSMKTHVDRLEKVLREAGIRLREG